jgi:hypothetical protein
MGSPDSCGVAAGVSTDLRATEADGADPCPS